MERCWRRWHALHVRLPEVQDPGRTALKVFRLVERIDHAVETVKMELKGLETKARRVIADAGEFDRDMVAEFECADELVGTAGKFLETVCGNQDLVDGMAAMRKHGRAVDPVATARGDEEDDGDERITGP